MFSNATSAPTAMPAPAATAAFDFDILFWPQLQRAPAEQLSNFDISQACATSLEAHSFALSLLILCALLQKLRSLALLLCCFGKHFVPIVLFVRLCCSHTGHCCCVALAHISIRLHSLLGSIALTAVVTVVAQAYAHAMPLPNFPALVDSLFLFASLFFFLAALHKKPVWCHFCCCCCRFS